MLKFSGFFSLIVSALVFILIPFTNISHAENIPIYGCYQKNHGQLRVVESLSECLKSEVPISWAAQSNNIVDYLAIYVNISIGSDEVGYGFSKDKPFKTISYALSKVPVLRSHSEIRTGIYVAAGTYNESIKINITKISLKGESVTNTFIVGDGVEDVVYISGNVVGRMTGFSISNGGNGINCNSSSFAIVECEIKNNNGYAGLLVQDNCDVYLDKSEIFSNTGNGISVLRSSSLIANGSSVQGNNKNGLEVWYASTAGINYSEFIDNHGNGIQVGGGSSLRLSHSKILDNNLCGIDSTSISTALLRGGNLIKGNNIDNIDWRGGVGVYQGSEFTVTNDSGAPKDQIIENYQNGIMLSNNSTSLIKDALIADNIGDGIDLNFGSSASFEYLVDITGNQGWGILCSDAVLRNSSNVFGNTLGDVNCP